MNSQEIQVLQKMEGLVAGNNSKTGSDSSRSEKEECSDIVESLNAAVLQYLENFGMEESYTAFCQECKSRGIPLPQDIPEPSFPSSSFGSGDGDRLLELFDKEEGQEMLQVWEKLLQDMEQSEMEAVRTITFYLQIYVAVIPFRLNKSEEEKSIGMAGLREFFDGNPDDLAPDENTLSLYALPYVANPMQNRVFKGIFRDPWRNKLRSQVSNVIRHHIKGKKSSPRIISCELMQMFLKCMKGEESGSESDSNARQTEPAPEPKSCVSATCQTEGIYPPKSSLELKAKEHLKELREQRREVENLKRGLNVSEDRYYKLLRVTAEVVNSLENAVQGKAQDIEELLGRLQSVFPELFPGSEFISENKTTESNNPNEEGFEEEYTLAEAEKESNADAGDLGNSEVVLQSKPDPGLPPLPYNMPRASGSNKYDDQAILSEFNEAAAQEEESLDSPTVKRQIEKERPDSGGANKPRSRQGESRGPQKYSKTSVPLPRKNDKSKTGISKDSSLLELLTTSDTDEPVLFGTKPDKKSKRNRSSNLIVHNPMSNHQKKPIEKETDESNGVEESTSYINLRRFLKTQPQFSARSEDHPLSNYQQKLPHTSSTDSWLQKSILVLDAKQKIDYTAKVMRGSIHFNERPASPLKLMKVKGHIEESISPRKPIVIKAQSKGIVRKNSKAQHEQNASPASTNVPRPKQSKKEVLAPEKADPFFGSTSNGRKLATAKKSRNMLQHKNISVSEAVPKMDDEARDYSFSNEEEGALEIVETRKSKPFRRISRSDSDVRGGDA